MKILAKAGRDDIATVYIAKTGEDKIVEFVESLQPPIPREDKWVLIVSTLYGCPVKCSICDAGGDYQGKISYNDILFQIDYLILRRYPDRRVPAGKFKIQFARMGEPALNYDVIKVLETLPERYNAPGLIPCISTIAPAGCEKFFTDLLKVKNHFYPEKFQLQFSIHSTDVAVRNKIIPVKKWSLKKISDYGEIFYKKGGRKITLNFAFANNIPVEAEIIYKYFPAEFFLIKVTPVNPTKTAFENKIDLEFPREKAEKFVNNLKKFGYNALVSIGEVEENRIGSNCGMYVNRFRRGEELPVESYDYELEIC